MQPVCRKGKRTVGGEWPRQLGARDYQCVKEHHSDFFDRTEYDKEFQETVKIYQQGKDYYDALKSVHNLVKDARKVQKSILLIGEISDIYVNSFQKMLSDETTRRTNFPPLPMAIPNCCRKVPMCWKKWKVWWTSTGFPCRIKNGWTLSTGRITPSGTTGIWWVIIPAKYFRFLPAGEKEKGHWPGNGFVRFGGWTLLVTSKNK